jgi:pimeloyl-ACP methyl ester carboxylesterase
MEPDNYSKPVSAADLQHADPAALTTSRDLPSLARKWARAVEQGRGIRLEAGDLDLFTTIGVTERIQAQTMLVAAANDRGGGPPDDTRAMAAAIPGARFEVIKGSGHIVNYEATGVLGGCIGGFLEG